MQHRSFRPRRRALVPAAVVLAATLGSLAGGATAAPLQDAAKPAGPPPTPVRVAVVDERPLAPRRLVTGELRSPRTSLVAAREAGIVNEMFVHEGDSVKAGAILARLDDEPIKIERLTLEADIAAAQAVVKEREEHVTWAQRDLAMVRTSVSGGGGNAKELSDAESRERVSVAQQAQATRLVDALKAKMKQIDRRGRDLEVKAPFAGVVTRRATESGQWLAAGGAVVEVTQVDRLEAWFSVPQALFPQGGRVPEGIDVEVDSLRRTLKLERLRVVPRADSRARAFETVGDVPNPDGGLIPGMSVTAFVPEGPIAPVQLVPKDALLRSETGFSVYSVRNGMAMPVAVRTLFPVGDRYAIAAGALKAGDVVVVEGNERLFPMTPVAPIGDAPAPATQGDSRAHQ